MEKTDTDPVSNPDRAQIRPGDHLIYEDCGNETGPTMIVFGSIHGNEAAGLHAVRRVGEKLKRLKPKINGRIFLLAGNTRAIARGVRFIDSDLNRHWTPENVARSMPSSSIPPTLSEDFEQVEILQHLIGILDSAHDEVYVLDLHSTSAAGVPFATVGDTLRNRAFALQFPVTILLGIEEQLEGTLLEYLNNRGTVTLGFEGGQHFAESTIDTHEALIWLGLQNARMIEPSESIDVEYFRDVLKKSSGRSRIVEVRYRHAISGEDQFEMLPGFSNFDPIEHGQMLARDRTGEITAPDSGLMLMPLYQALGEDGFFIGRQVAGFWLRLSGVLRRIRVGSLIHLLPAVRRVGNDPNILEVDTVIARFFPLQIFHLLGFRKLRWHAGKLIVARRNFDTSSPFTGR